jgi:hypothetical protein
MTLPLERDRLAVPLDRILLPSHVIDSRRWGCRSSWGVVVDALGCAEEVNRWGAVSCAYDCGHSARPDESVDLELQPIETNSGATRGIRRSAITSACRRTTSRQA